MFRRLMPDTPRRLRLPLAWGDGWAVVGLKQALYMWSPDTAWVAFNPHGVQIRPPYRSWLDMGGSGADTALVVQPLR